MPPLPDPRAEGSAPYAADRRRTLRVHGGDVELVWLPARTVRHGRAGPQRPPFLPDAGARIVAEEAVWRGDGCVLTPNRYPFATQQWILWTDPPAREPAPAFQRTLLQWVDATGCTALQNMIGAAATIARAHAHATVERLPFLTGLGERPLHARWLPAVPGVRYGRADVPFALLVLRGDAGARAAALGELLLLRMTPACSIVSEPGVTFVMPRSVETPAPWFPAALGSAELWGRWCYGDEAAFAAATATDLEHALRVAGADADLLG